MPVFQLPPPPPIIAYGFSVSPNSHGTGPLIRHSNNSNLASSSDKLRGLSPQSNRSPQPKSKPFESRTWSPVSHTAMGIDQFNQLIFFSILCLKFILIYIFLFSSFFFMLSRLIDGKILISYIIYSGLRFLCQWHASAFSQCGRCGANCRAVRVLV